MKLYNKAKDKPDPVPPRRGRDRIAGTRVEKDAVRSLYTRGFNADAIRRIFPELTVEQIDAVVMEKPN